MFELKMGSNLATTYFQKLEQEAKLAGQRDDEGEHDTMVRAVRLRVPASYTSFIANVSVGVPHTYSNWKNRILLMYEEHQCKYMYDQTHSADQRNDK